MNFEQIRLHGKNIRVHGNGFVQIDLPHTQQRVHVWGAPGIPQQAQPTPIHDHNFSFTSTVLRGRMVNVMLYLSDGPLQKHTHTVCRVVTRQGADTILQKTSMTGYLKVDSEPQWLEEGDTYNMRFGELHETFVNQPTVTFMTKTWVDPEYPIRVLCPIDREPDNVFTRYDLDESRLWDIVREIMQ